MASHPSDAPRKKVWWGLAKTKFERESKFGFGEGRGGVEWCKTCVVKGESKWERIEQILR